MSRRNRSRYTVLACLSVRPMSGYDIKQFLERTVAHFWSESFGQIYPTLKQLEAEGLIRTEIEAGGPSGRDRRVHTLTEAGLEALRGWLVEPPEPDVPRYELSLKLFFGDQLAVADAAGHVRAHRDRHEEVLARYRESEARLEAELAGSPRLPYWLAVLRGGIRYSAMVVEWCDETLAALDALDPAAYPADPSAPVVPTSRP